MKIAIIDYEYNKSEIKNVSFISFSSKSNIINPIDHLGHGEICLKIIDSLVNASIFCLEIPLHSEDSIDYFCMAIQWCIDNNIKLINISIGTPNFKNFYKINQVCQRAFNAGIIMVSAVSNNNEFTYPACLPYVIGVKYYGILPPSKYIFSWYPLNGIDILINSDIPLLNKRDKKIEKLTSNSYATAYTTSIIANILIENSIISYTQLKKELGNLSLFKKRNFCSNYEQFVLNPKNCPSQESVAKIITTQLATINNINKITVPVIEISIKNKNGIILLNHIKNKFIDNGYNILVFALNKYLEHKNIMLLDCIDYIYPDNINKNDYYYTIQRIRNADILFVLDLNVYEADLHLELGDNIFDVSFNCLLVGDTTEQCYKYIKGLF